ncbi:pyridoxamine 5'-phosphate oxidase family protein [Microlunatus antarcticus]|uniref:Nitroimidazol reductase NimA-like FMN-containing flavoprotein (Pyridoxamine 5'-phosphate oxidase superfamily) n=1 Tax=Microlunatus antarcticus TaxID=53388 RepID=A0A7W5P7A7_9ACTN|nr:pyridoxamine 5'-phosphate oxidase family protein [Microlunatus antarcticus]MBB3327232.1 nitroimidazol reductase NimA-like FMN-containing flavoprotein (pyridoxamine 5'-phosphate oxidase superfamily) [Microlunatus antarcticus]
MSALAPAEIDADVRELSAERCRELLELATVGRLGYVSSGGVQIVPLSYRAAGGVLYLRTRPGSLVDQLAEGGREVAFQVDSFTPGAGLAWSVLMQGRVQTLDAADLALVHDLQRAAMPWTGGHLRDLRFVPSSFSGRTITHVDA